MHENQQSIINNKSASSVIYDHQYLFRSYDDPPDQYVTYSSCLLHFVARSQQRASSRYTVGQYSSSVPCQMHVSERTEVRAMH